MKKVLGITFGKLQKKIIVFVLILVAVTTAVFTGVSLYQSSMLAGVVSDTRDEQQKAISTASEETMYQVIKSSLVRTTSLQAAMADNEFSEVVNNLYMIQTMAEGILANRDSMAPARYTLPDPSKDGTPASMVLHEEGVDYRSSKYLGAIAHLASPMTAMFANSDKISGCYIGLSDGTHFGIDNIFSNKYDADGNLIPFPVRERPWYKGAVEADGLYFTGIEADSFSGIPAITASIPVKADGEIVGVAGIDIVLSSVDDFMALSADNGSFVFVVNSSGHVVLAPENNGLFEVQSADEAEDLRESDNKELAEFVTAALKAKTDLTVVKINDKEYYMAGAPMPKSGWAVISLVDKERTELPEKQMLAEYDKINDAASSRFREGSSRANRNSLFLILLILVGGSVAGLIVAGKMVEPIAEMTKDIRHTGQTGEPFVMKDSYRTNDEIEILAEAFDDLNKKTRKYIDDITQITAEKERVTTELQMANQIQNSMLPHIFPAYPSRHEFDVYASMDPAKEVGGDFYDFFLIDDDHLCMVMADVSGKGVPAALFMMVSKIILQSCAMLGKSAAEILKKTNEAICSNNQQQMFVTVWLGILEISTGKVTAANAGHEYPAVMRNGKFTLLKDKHGFVIGGFEESRYKEYEIDLRPGDKLFLYTDGVPEATDSQNRMFGVDRMIDALNEDPDASPDQILLNVRRKVDEFASGAEQFDDLTMMCMKYNGNE